MGNIAQGRGMDTLWVSSLSSSCQGASLPNEEYCIAHLLLAIALGSYAPKRSTAATGWWMTCCCVCGNFSSKYHVLQDLLLGVNVFVKVLLHGWRTGPVGSPVSFETKFGWILSSNAEPSTPISQVTTHRTSVEYGDDVLRRFWETEEPQMSDSILSLEECAIVYHYKTHHSHTEEGRFIVPFPKKPGRC